ncbi:MAG: PKD domain-containing protein, partial [Gammaproteobacteria bacterium]|nr:PKD domain-containing protein [Gammaproteobacteria bacterium]
FNYGDGQTGTDETHTYNSGGNYSVTLTAYDADNDCYVYKYVTIYVDDECGPNDANAIFTATPPSGDAPLTVTFNTAGSVGSLFFNYGDGQTGTSKTHTYQNPGTTYMVTLTATANNCTDTASRTVKTNPEDCDAVATFTSVVDGSTVTFTTAGSVGTLSWNYGDGQTGTDVSHTYAAAGTYTVTLTAYDSANDCSRTLQKPVTVEICDAVAAFTSATDDLAVTFDTTGSVGTLSWDYGDGETGTDASHTYAAAGTYTVTLTAYDSVNDCYTPLEKPVTVEPCDADATFTFVPDDLTVTFDTTGSVGNLTWNYGDGATGTGTSHTYTAGGTYSVTLTATDGSCTDTDTQAVTVTSPTYFIKATAGDNGGIYPEGDEVAVASGNNIRFEFRNDIGFEVSEVLVDGQSVTVASFYKFFNVASNHTIHVNFAEITDINYYTDPQTDTKALWEKRVEVDVKPGYFPDLHTEVISMVQTFNGVSVWGVQAVTSGVSIITLDSMGAMGLDTPNGHSMPLGLVGSVFEIENCDSSASARTIEVDIFLRAPLPSENDDVRWIQYDKDNNNMVEMPAIFNDDNNDGYYESVTLSLEDGGEFDLDGQVNCEITDLSGLGIGIALSFTDKSVGTLIKEFETATQTASGLDMLVECIGWTFGDDAEDFSCVQTSTDGLHSTVQHEYAAVGQYTVTLVVKGANGTNSLTRTVEVTEVVIDGEGGGDNCFISAAAYDSAPKSNMNIALVVMLMTLAGMAVSFFRKAQK